MGRVWAARRWIRCLSVLNEFQPARQYSAIDVAHGSGKQRKFFFRAKTTDEMVIHKIFRNQQYELGGLRRSSELKSFLARRRDTGKSPLVIDAGANIGASAIVFASMIPDAKVVAIEPHGENFELLSRNVEGLPIEPMRAALSSAPGHARLVDPGEGHWGYRTENMSGAAPTNAAIPRVTIGDIYARYAGTAFPFIVKVDIEGGEADLFAANTEWAADTPLLIVELHDWLLPRSASSRMFLKCVSQLDRDFVFLGEDVYSIANDLN